MIWNYVDWSILAGVLVAAAVFDLRRGVVYNWLTYPAIVVGLALAAVQGAAAGDLGGVFFDRVLGFGLGFGVLFAAYLMGGMGGGDVKLMAAVGAFLGLQDTLDAIMYSFLVAVVVGLVVMVWKGETRTVARRLLTAFKILPLPTARMSEAVPANTRLVPFGFAVCVGTLWYLGESLSPAGRCWTWRRTGSGASRWRVATDRFA